MVKAYRIQDKVKGIGFEFHDAEDAWKKVDEEIQEFHAETDLDKKRTGVGGCFLLTYQLCKNFRNQSGFCIGKNQSEVYFKISKDGRPCLGTGFKTGRYVSGRNGCSLGKGKKTFIVADWNN